MAATPEKTTVPMKTGGESGSGAPPLGKKLDVNFLMAQMDRACWIAFRAVGSSAPAEDVVQETLVQFLKNPPKEHDEERIRDCFFRAVRLHAWKKVKAERSRRMREEKYEAMQTRTTVGPESVADAEEKAQAARAALASLPAKEREAVSLCCEQGMTHESAAHILGIPKPTLTHRLNRGLEKLRRTLAAQGFAVATPAALGGILSSLPLPVISETFKQTALQIATNPAAYGFISKKLSASVSATQKASGTIVWASAGAAILAAVGVGIWWADDSSRDVQAEKKDASAALVSDVKQDASDFSAPATTLSQPTEKLFRHWTFAEGPAADLSVLQGTWPWRADEADPTQGAILAAPGKRSLLHLPAKLPAAPVVLKVRLDLIIDAPCGISGFVTDGAVQPALKSWKNRTSRWEKSDGRDYVFHIWLLSGSYMLIENNGKVDCIIKYERTDFSGLELLFGGVNVAVKELQLWEVASEDVPAFLRNPEKLLKSPHYVLMEEAGVQALTIQNNPFGAPPPNPSSMTK